MIICLTHRSLVVGGVVDYIPHDLEEQTKVLLRLTMESPLTSNVSYDKKEKCTERVSSATGVLTSSSRTFIGERWIHIRVRATR